MTQPIVSVRKIEAAQRQLSTAIRLWFADAEPVSVHTLACAAHQIVHDINTDKSGDELLFDSNAIKDEFRIEFVRMMKRSMNFFKHADKDPDPDGSIEFDTRTTELFILFAILGLERLKYAHSFDTAAFVLYYAIKNPHLVTKHFSERVQFEKSTALPSISKADFIKQFNAARGR